MNLYNTTNIKSLPPVEQILPGNFIVVEDNVGTKKLDFIDFVIGPNNTSFYNPLDTRLKNLSSTVTHTLTSKTNIAQQIILEDISEPVLLSRNGIFTYTGTLSVRQGERIGTQTFLSPLESITIADINIATSTYSGSNYFTINNNGANIANPSYFNYTLSLSTQNTVNIDTIFYFKLISFIDFNTLSAINILSENEVLNLLP